MQHSIKNFLFTYITIAVLVTYSLLSLVSYLVSQEELNELYDANLKQVASAMVENPRITGSIPVLATN